MSRPDPVKSESETVPQRRRPVKQRTMSVDETMELYYRTEYSVVADPEMGLTMGGFLRLMSLLRLPEGIPGAKHIWLNQGKSERSIMSEDEYVKLMQRNKMLETTTRIWRYMFSICDTDGSGWATKREVIEGLEDMGIPVDEKMKDSITAMDRDKDDHVYYKDFLVMQLKMID